LRVYHEDERLLDQGVICKSADLTGVSNCWSSSLIDRNFNAQVGMNLCLWHICECLLAHLVKSTAKGRIIRPFLDLAASKSSVK
jgi:hypothetical protein